LVFSCISSPHACIRPRPTRFFSWKSNSILRCPWPLNTITSSFPPRPLRSAFQLVFMCRSSLSSLFSGLHLGLCTPRFLPVRAFDTNLTPGGSVHWFPHSPPKYAASAPYPETFPFKERDVCFPVTIGGLRKVSLRGVLTGSEPLFGKNILPGPLSFVWKPLTSARRSPSSRVPTECLPENLFFRCS